SFKMPDASIRNSAGKLGPGLDIRATGGYVLAPPSVHPSGRRYEWSVDCANAIAAAPAWLLQIIAAPTNGSGKNTTPPSEWRDLIKGVSEGASDCSLANPTGHLPRRHVDPFITLELIRVFNATRCTPPLPDKDVDKIVSSVAGLELKRRQVGNGWRRQHRRPGLAAGSRTHARPTVPCPAICHRSRRPPALCSGPF